MTNPVRQSGHRLLNAFQWLSILMVLACTLKAGAVAGADADAVAPEVRIGFQGQVKVGCWTPVVVRFDQPVAEEARIAVANSDFENNELVTFLDRVSPTEYSGMLQIGRLDGDLQVQKHLDQSTTVLSNLRLVPQKKDGPGAYRRNTEFWGIVGASGNFDAAAEDAHVELQIAQGMNSPIAVRAISLGWNELPLNADAWESLDVIVLGGEGFAVPEPQMEALKGWVNRGGRLVLTLGANTNAYKGTALSQWIPIQVAEQVEATSLEAVNGRVQGSTSLRMGVRRSVPVARIVGPPEGSLPGPVIWTRPYGFGLVSACAVDFGSPPLSTWQDQPRFLKQLALMAPVSQRKLSDDSDLSATGITDMASQMTSGLDQFAKIQRPSFRMVMLWTVLWGVVLFPLDYLVVHRLLGKPHLTWLTLPVLIGVATIAAARTATSANTAQLIMNQIDLLEIDSELNQARSHSWMTFYSGETARYDIAAQSKLGGQAEVGWNAKPEEGLRGMYRQGGGSVGLASYSTTASHDRLEHVPVRLWSSYGVRAQWEKTSSQEVRYFSESLTEADGGRLKGTITSHLPDELTDWIVVYKNFVYYPSRKRGTEGASTWLPGTEWRPEIDGEPTLVKVYLTGRRERLIKSTSGTNANLDQITAETVPYEIQERDPVRMFRTLMFHESAGGPSYTGLTNHPLARLDMSRLLETGRIKGNDRAILVGRLKQPVMSYHINGEDVLPTESWTFVRAVLPVKIP